MDEVVSDADMSLPRTHIEEMDFAEMKHRQAAELAKIQQDGETKRAKLRASEARQETYKVVAAGFFIAAVLICIILAFWNPWAPPEAPAEDKEYLREQACVESGGGWVPDEMFYDKEKGLCVYPGKSVEVPSE
jgi:hypothetical protein